MIKLLIKIWILKWEIKMLKYKIELTEMWNNSIKWSLSALLDNNFFVWIIINNIKFMFMTKFDNDL